jgi:hypothetical protein
MQASTVTKTLTSREADIMAAVFGQCRQIEQVIEQVGLAQGLRLLHSRSPYRFTSLYRFGGHPSCNPLCYDRDNPSATAFPADIPVTAPYCVFAMESCKPFQTPDAMMDPGLEHHPDRGVVRSYIGTPLIDKKGRVVGSLCHFDLHPLTPPEDVRIRLYEVGEFVAENLSSLY